MAELVVHSNRTTQWVGQKGLQFARRIGRIKRHDLYRFVERYASSLPVKVKIVKLDRTRATSAMPIILNNEEKISFIYKRFMVIMRLEDLHPAVQDQIGRPTMCLVDIINS